MVGFRLRLAGVTQRFGGVCAVDNVDLEVPPGQVVGLVGPNGAGKTSVLNSVSGVTRINGGSIWLDDHPIRGLAAHQIARLGVGRTFQSTEHFYSFTALDYMLLGRIGFQPGSLARTCLSLPSVWRSERAEKASARNDLDAVGLKDMAETRLQDLPYGVRKTLDIARARRGDKRLLLLDEPTSGTQQEDRRALRGVLRNLEGGGVTVLVVDHDTAFLSTIVERMVVMAQGRVIADGDPSRVLADPEVIRIYLGAPDEQVLPGGVKEDPSGSGGG
jgi:branched-chain amino acid transport system ATP-binding protein